METLLTVLAATLATLIASAYVRVNLPVLGPTPVLGIIALAVALAAAAPVLYLIRSMLRDRAGRRAWHPWTVTA